MQENLKSLILLALADDDERFESIYHSVNDIPYINHSVECNPLYSSLNEFPKTNHNPENIFKYVQEYINCGYIECLDEEGKLTKPNFTNFEVFSRYWLKLTKKGQAELLV